MAKFVNKRDRTVHSPRPASYSRCVSLDESDYLTHDGRKREGKESACLTLPGMSRLRAKSLMARCIAMRASLCIPCMRHAFILHLERNRYIELDIRAKERRGEKYKLQEMYYDGGKLGRHDDRPFDKRVTCVLQG